MRRLFSSRYLLFGLALFAMWLIGRGRTVDSVTSVASKEGFVPIGSIAHDADAVNGVRVACVTTPEAEGMNDCSNSDCRADVVAVGSLPDADVNKPGIEELMAEDLGALLNLPAEHSQPVEPLPVSLSDSEESAESIEAPVESMTDSHSIHVAGIANSNEVAGGLTKVVADPDALEVQAPRWTTNPYATQPIVDDDSNQSSKQGLDTIQLEESILESYGALNNQTDSSVGLASQHQASQSIPEAVESAKAQLTESVAQAAAHHIEYGKSLSRRGAVFAARQEFFAALAMIAHDHDSQVGGTDHGTALRRGVQAIREAGDFLADDAENQIGLNVRHVIETHSTQIISQREADDIVPVEAMQRYFSFAQQQLTFAGGHNVVSAEALFCLGKLHSAMAQHQPEQLDVAKAIVYHRASLENDPRNYRSANELGVLLARSGQLEKSRDLLKKSLTIRPATRAWQNLAAVHQRLGEQQLAQLAASESAITANQELTVASSSPIRWLPAGEFNALAPADFHDATTPAQNPVRTASNTEEVKEDSKIKSFAEKLKSWF